MDCMLLGSEKSKIADFRRGILNHPIYNDIDSFPEFAWTVVSAVDTIDPNKQAMKFRAVLILKNKTVSIKKPAKTTAKKRS